MPSVGRLCRPALGNFAIIKTLRLSKHCAYQSITIIKALRLSKHCDYQNITITKALRLSKHYEKDDKKEKKIEKKVDNEKEKNFITMQYIHYSHYDEYACICG